MRILCVIHHIANYVSQAFVDLVSQPEISDVYVSAGRSSCLSFTQHRQCTLVVLINAGRLALQSLTKYDILYINYRRCPIAYRYQFGFS